ncbi:hypothetical protein BJX65DRAFT_285994 [Aspergillus insuetus]
MFIHYTGPSSEKEPGVRGAINAVVAASANLKRQQQRQRRQDAKTNNETNGTKDEAVGLRWLHDRPLIVSEPQKKQLQVQASAEKASAGARGGDKPIKKLNPDSAEEGDEELYLWDGRIQRFLGDGVSYPTPKKAYYPSLLFQRQNIFLVVAHQYPRTFAHNIYNAWTQKVLSDACLFHATLFATSSFMDVMQRKQNNPVTLRHKGEMIRLVKKAVSEAPTHGLRDEVIAVTTYLVYFGCLSGNFEEASQHDSGITAMMAFKGASSLPEDTYQGYLIRIRDVWNSIVYHAGTLFPFSAGPMTSSGCYTSLLALATQKQWERSLELRLPVPIVNYLVKFNNKCIAAVEYEWSDRTLPTPETTTNAENDHALQCISITSEIYWTAVTRDLDPKTKYSKSNNTATIQRLKAALLKVDNLFWLRLGPEVLRWILMVGATAAASLPDQAFFILRSYMITSVIEPWEMDGFLVGADHLLWVFNRRDEGDASEVLGGSRVYDVES